MIVRSALHFTSGDAAFLLSCFSLTCETLLFCCLERFLFKYLCAVYEIFLVYMKACKQVSVNVRKFYGHFFLQCDVPRLTLS